MRGVKNRIKKIIIYEMDENEMQQYINGDDADLSQSIDESVSGSYKVNHLFHL